MVYSSLYEIVVDFTRDYDTVRQALKKVEHYDKTCVENMLQAVKSMLSTNWGSQNYSQVLVFSDLGIGFGPSSVRSLIESLEKDTGGDAASSVVSQCLPFSKSSKLSFVCLGNPDESYYQCAVRMYQQLLDTSGQMGQLFLAPKRKGSVDDGKESKADLDVSVTTDAESVQHMIAALCEVNYKQFEATLKCGGFGKLEAAISIWPSPLVSLLIV